jgi:Rad3-related DNA helicase
MQDQTESAAESQRQASASLLTPCPSCGKENRPAAKYCRYCGITLPAKTADGPAASDKQETGRAGDYIGLEKIREALNRQKSLFKLQKERRRRGMGGEERAMVFIFQGDTGTGKTLAASCFIAELQREKCFDSDRVLHKSAKELSVMLKNEFDIFNHLKDNDYAVLVIDEAHTDAAYLHELLLALDKTAKSLLCVIIGLKDPLTEFFTKNPEDVRRVTETFDFPNQTDDELALILERELDRKKMQYEPALKDQFIPYIQESRYNPDPSEALYCSTRSLSKHFSRWSSAIKQEAAKVFPVPVSP